jgi:DNA-binding IclR family transcriptional regulator
MSNSSAERIKLGSRGGTESADRVADVLLLFAQTDRPLGVSEIARSLSLSKAVVHRILQSLTARSLTWAVSDDATYILGPAATTLSMRAWSQLDLRSLAAPILRKLRDDTRETTTLSVLVGHQRMYLDQYESPQEVKMVVDLGPRFPLHSGASSRAILAHLPQRVIDNAVTQLREIRPELDVTGYLRRLEDIRNKGYAVSLNERGTGAASIAAPFFDSAGNVLGSISSSGPVFRYGEEGHEDHVRLVVTAAEAVTSELAKQRR